MKEAILSMYRSAKAEWKERRRELAASAMVLQNLEDILPDWEMTYFGSKYFEFNAPEDTTVPEFMKVIDRLAKKLNIEPQKGVSENNVKAVFQVYFWPTKTFKDRRGYTMIHLEFGVKNSEPCEITYKRKMRKIPVLTGYCKEIAEQKHLNHKTNEETVFDL